METHKQIASDIFRGVGDQRLCPRFKIKVEVTVRSKTHGTINGYSVDLSESGISAMLTLEVPVGEMVELEFTLPHGPVITYATVRQRSAFRYGFQFVKSHDTSEVLRATCRQLEVEHTLLAEIEESLRDEHPAK